MMETVRVFLARLADAWARPAVRSGVSTALTVFVVALVIYALQKALVEVDFAQVVRYVQQTSTQALLLAMLSAALSYLALTGYDFSALRYLSLPKPLPRTAVAVTSFMSYALGNTVGLGVLAGGAVRLRMFTQWGLSPLQVTRVVAFNALAFGAGITCLGALALLLAADRIAHLLSLPSAFFKGSAVVVLLLVALLLWCCWRYRNLRLGSWHLELPSLGLALRQLAITATDTFFAALTLWFLLPHQDLAWWTFFTFFLLAMTAGVISHVPGGLGVFEVVMLAGLSGSLSTTSLAAALVLYRFVYYLLPLVAAAVLMGAYALWLRYSRATDQPSAWRLTSTAIAQGTAWVTPLLLGALTFAAGVVLLVSGATPASEGEAGLHALHVPVFLIEASHLIGSVCGLVLLVLARGIVYRLDAAWWLALIVCGIAFWLTMPKGVTIYEIALVLPLFALLLISRKEFDRRSSFVAMRFEFGWILAILATVASIAWILYLAYEYNHYGDEQWWQLALDVHAPRTLRAATLLAVAALLWGTWQLLRRPDAWAGSLVEASSPDGEVTVASGFSMATLPSLYESKGLACQYYRALPRSWVALGEPVGAKNAWPDVLRAFIETAHSRRLKPAFYLTQLQRLDLYLDANLRVHKLGDYAWLPLSGLGLEAFLADSLSKAEVGDYRFALLDSAQTYAHFPGLQGVSQLWLQECFERSASGFAPAPLNAARLAAGPVAAVLREGAPVAFASLAPVSDAKHLGIESMRCVANAPAAHAFLLTELVRLLHALGIKQIGLGLAPLPQAEQEGRSMDSNWLRTARRMVPHGEFFYHFRDFEERLQEWPLQRQPHGLASQGALASLLALADLAGVVRLRALRGNQKQQG